MEIKVKSQVGNGIGIGGIVTQIFAYIEQINWLAVVGIVVSVGGFAISWYYNYQRNKREQAESALRIKKLEQEIRDNGGSHCVCPARGNINAVK